MSIRSEAWNISGSAVPDPGGIPGARIPAVIVDDVPVMLETVGMVLQAEGHVKIVARARDGVEAVEAVAKLAPALVVMDVRMPRMSGLEAAALIVRHFPQTRVVLMSGEDTPELREQSRTCRADAFVPKVRLASELPGILERLFFVGDTCFIA